MKSKNPIQISAMNCQEKSQEIIILALFGRIWQEKGVEEGTQPSCVKPLTSMQWMIITSDSFLLLQQKLQIIWFGHII